MIDKDIGDIVESDLQALISNAVSEGRKLDYKEQLTIQRDGDKKEFLADVSSFANASGGDMIIGVSESKGIPKALVGIVVTDQDATKLQVEQLVRDGIQPRIVGVRLRWIDLSNSRKALVLRVPRSWNPPHRVTFKGHDRFYGRSSAGKYPLDVGELRNTFNQTASISERLRNFRAERISAISSGEMPIPFVSTAKVVIHIIPMTSLGHEVSIDLDKIRKSSRPPIGASGWDTQFNFDGLLVFSPGSPQCSTYVQYYRDGVIEAVDGRTLKPYVERGKDAPPRIPSKVFERSIREFIAAELPIMGTMGILPPVVIFVTFVAVKGYRMAIDSGPRLRPVSDEGSPIDRDVLMLPEVVVEDLGKDVSAQLTPIFNLVWNACGFEKSLNPPKG